MPTCPNGHHSVSEDWCEVCGHRMAGAGAPAGAVPPPPGPSYGGYGYPGPDGGATMQAELCPQCRTPREAMAPFCEECRYNFQTRTPSPFPPGRPGPGAPVPPHGTGPGAPVPPHGTGPGGPRPGAGMNAGMNMQPGYPQTQGPRPQDPFDYQGSRPSQMNRPAEPLHGDPAGGYPPPGQPGGPQGGYGGGHPGAPAPGPQQPGADDWMLPPPGGRAPHPQQAYQPAAPPQPHAPQHQQPHPGQGMPGQGMPGQPVPGQPMPGRPMPGQPMQGGHPGNPGHPGAGHPGQPQQGQGMYPGQQQPYPGQGGSWSATIGPDRAYFMAMMQRSGPEAAGLNLPAYSPEQHLPLTGGQITIGRRRQSTGESPDIDLSVPPEDPGVSHQHAVLVQQPDGSWAVVDQNSTNGTTVNGGDEPIQPFVPIPLGDGDQVHVGAWTTITIRRG
ncbi:FHA domain-containing protein [Streptomyces sp. NRRL S-87]|uniref:FHA domain-containing protein n=1 Tax=Streptomyces sp. NRRL S-87 TaxID=1463920 RepID=UPI0004BEA5FD|nr:FHA domain-containing protein [Streptomyces sp. NRRL S-87]